MTTDASGSNPFAGFAGFKPADMLDRMWDMMRMSPFGGMASFPGAASGLPPSLSSMSDMMAPLTSVEELDKRITDLRAVEQWLKLNLGMLQSAIQALEVQRATLATLRAFGAFAQSSMSAAEDAAVAAAQAASAPRADAPRADAPQAPDAAAAADAPPAGDAAQQAFDPAGWWNLLQAQFNQLASLAMAQPGAQPDASGAAPSGQSASTAQAEPPAPAAAAPRKPAAKRAKPAGSAAARAAAASSPETRPPKRST
ncbi:PhaM family polyhydroxyalkanoate granule multifunctional regulatory protein [Burkholderia territorii]|uniref:PhaM family polyhydroxyalkanoate granule multifunctional regulatory protein n=1 Tax=Burkholderia territorii TaxID=1503055 RepID=UPI0007547335|nr:PhaM family polyhydroxyalkanoate granule multifunctional regulatory protein [Burkholderia territorii]KWE33413.1 alginate biosynthesis protein AlgP [Burkholderia territorii]KWE42251.1 alginate biosynthesis protein AlgP [Burkholderia territorii]KWE42987.1 alginate biosynthesis protein AlgP [Burkholderia territorii]